MEKLKIIRIDSFRDGGTTSIHTNQGHYCISIDDLTKGMLFEGHPDSGKILSSEEAKLVKRKIKTALKSFTGQIREWQIDKIKNIKTK